MACGSAMFLAAAAGEAHAADQQVCARAVPLVGSNIVIGKDGTRLMAGEAAAIQTGQGASPGESSEIEFAADQIEYDSESEIVTATGNVVLDRGEQQLRADQVVWNRKTGLVEATGNVRVVDQDGNKLYGDSITLTDSIRDGVIDNILVVLGEGGRLAANSGEREDGFITLHGAAYSPCAVERPNGKPKDTSWQIRAIKVVYSPVDKRVRYTGARLELFGLPVIPLPGLSHPVGEERGSGLLVPDLRFSEANGVELQQPYYFSLAPNRDLTVTASIYSQVLPMVSARYRALTGKGAYQVAAYATSSSRIAVGGANAIAPENQFRGYIDANGSFQLSPSWNVSGSVRRTTDRTFLRRYDISRDDRLRSTVAAQRIDENSYFSLAGWATQTLRVNDPQGQVPIALPIMDYHRRLDDPVLGGKVEFQVNTLAIGRTTGQDSQRAFASARWDMRRLTRWGQEFTLTAYGRADLYNSDENLLSPTAIYRGNRGVQTRAIGTLAADLQWPFIGEAFGGTQILTPRVQIVATPDTPNLSIPNEDSRAIELEDSNLFALNRLPGYDRIEDGVRIVYGVEWSLRRPGMTIDATVGQSYRFNDHRDFLPDGTGLAERTSDVVGRTDIRFGELVKFTHRFRLDKDNLAVRRNEIDATVGTRGTYAQIGYLRLNRDIGPGIEDLQDREELRLAGRVRVARYWSVFGSGVFDLSNRNEDPTLLSDGFEPIRTRLGIAYEDDCLELGLTWRRDYVSTGDAQRGNTFLLRVAFRNLGF
ncbi:MAG: LPS assembly protein LptD [Blastomonas sp.]